MDWTLLRRWDNYLAVTERSPSTRRQYRRTFVNLLADLMLDPGEVSEDDVVTYLAGIDSRGGMRNNVLRAASSFYRWAADRGEMDNPVKRLHLRKPRLTPAPFHEEEQIIRLFLGAWAHRPADPRRCWAILLAYGTGARVESLCALEPADVHLDGRRPGIHFRVAKGDRPYFQPLGRSSELACRELLRAHPSYGRKTLLGVGPGMFWKWVKDAARAAEVDSHPHLLRHTFGTVTAPLTDPSTWADLMNHSDLSQYKRYAGVYEEREREAMRRI